MCIVWGTKFLPPWPSICDDRGQTEGNAKLFNNAGKDKEFVAGCGNIVNIYNFMIKCYDYHYIHILFCW